jgi:hypothetical protein
LSAPTDANGHARGANPDAGAFEWGTSAPVAYNDYHMLEMNASLMMTAPGVLANDRDPDNTPLTAVAESGPAVGTYTLNANGSFSYAPPLGYLGVASASYHVSDGQHTSGSATVTFLVVEEVLTIYLPTIRR